MSESNAEFQKRLDAETDASEVQRLVEDRKHGLLSDRVVAKLDVAIDADGAKERLDAIEEQIKNVEALAS